MAVSDDEQPVPAPLPPPTLDDPGAGAAQDPEGEARARRERRDAADRRRAETKKPRSLGRRITFWVGIGLLLAGLGLLAYVAYQLWVTNWISQRAQKEEINTAEENWAVGEGCDRFCPHGEVSALIRIPRFGKDYVMPVLEGTTDELLARGIGHFEDTSEPDPDAYVKGKSKPGNFALAGHRVTHGEPLRDMPDLRPGDLIYVETRLNTFTYRLDTDPNDLVIPFTGTWVLNAEPKNPDGGVGPPLTKPDKPDPACKPSRTVHCDIKDMYKHILTLTTCSEIFHTDNRMIAFAHLIQIRDKEIITKTTEPPSP